jgi:hypothetical protein
MRSPPAGAPVVGVFSELMTDLLAEMKTRPVFDASSALPLPLPVDPASDPDPVQVRTYGKRAAEPLTSVFSKATVYTLKRVAGEQVLDVIREKESDRAALSAWFGTFAAAMAARKVAFGLPERDRGDRGFHEAWARRADLEILKWEALNRIHRTLNEAFRKSSSHGSKGP